MKGERYDDVEDIQANVTRELHRISKEPFLDSFQWLYERSKCCINVETM